MSIATPRTTSVITRPSSPVFRHTPGRQAMLPQIYLHPGQMHVTAEACGITTVLGSCVAVCLFDARQKVGGINHFLLPDHCNDPVAAGRYGPSATQKLLDRMFALGARAETMTARLVGGANVLSALRITPSLGSRNAEVAADVLTAAGVLITALDIGGGHGRKLVFSPREGITWIKLLGR
jgi:chemotaxis protein CheD